MAKRRKKAGAAAHRTHPDGGLRVPVSHAGQIKKFADALSTNRTYDAALFAGRGRKKRPRCYLSQVPWQREPNVDRAVRAVVADVKANAAERAAERAPDADKVAAEIKALRAREQADALINAERDRLALAKALKP